MNWIDISINWTVYAAVTLLCITGLVLSCLSFSGTWLVSAAAILTVFLSGDQFAGWICVSAFLGISAVVEAVEQAAGTIGVTKRGGSRLAGVMAAIGGIAGAILGTLIPVPLLGSLIGMLALSFASVYLVEYIRLKKHDKAAEIAAGTLTAKAGVILLKVLSTLGMAVFLVIKTVSGA